MVRQPGLALIELPPSPGYGGQGIGR
jgi:hypothetical protein